MSKNADELLAKLDPQARARVEGQLKEVLDRELAQQAGRPGGMNPAASFSRGILFSKSGASARLDDEILPQLGQMDEAKFKTFMDRITVIRGMRTPSAGG